MMSYYFLCIAYILLVYCISGSGGLVQGVTKAVTDLELSMIAEEWERYAEVLREK